MNPSHFRPTRPFSALHVLLVQARDAADIEVQEQQCFRERCRLRIDQVTALNVTRDALAPERLDGFDALLIGGSGEFSAGEDYPWMDDLLTLTRAAGERALPTFGSCWGHQVIARAFGGRVEHDAAKAELGCFPVTLTDAGRTDPLLRDFPDRFLANMGHHDRVTVLPDGAVDLAYSETQPHQAFRLGDVPVYGTQFHSELDARRERERLLRYRHLYPEMKDDTVFAAIIGSLAETTEVDHLLHDFLRKFAAHPEASADAEV